MFPSRPLPSAKLRIHWPPSREVLADKIEHLENARAEYMKTSSREKVAEDSCQNENCFPACRSVAGRCLQQKSAAFVGEALETNRTWASPELAGFLAFSGKAIQECFGGRKFAGIGFNFGRD